MSRSAMSLEELKPTGEDLVVCHGDHCFPNVVIEGEVTAYLDLGELAVAPPALSLGSRR